MNAEIMLICNHIPTMEVMYLNSTTQHIGLETCRQDCYCTCLVKEDGDFWWSI